MKARHYHRGEISLGYVLKYGLGAGLVLMINTAFDYVSGSIYTYKVQLMATSPHVRAVKDCVYQTILSGSYSRLGDCGGRGRARGRYFDDGATPVDIDLNGEIRLTDVVNGAEVNLTLTPIFGSDGNVRWHCTGQAEKYLPDSCSAR